MPPEVAQPGVNVESVYLRSMDDGFAGGSRRIGRIVRTGLALLSVQGLTWASSILALSVAPRFLGADQYGISAAATMLVSLGALLAGFGTNNYLVKETARSPASVRTLVANAVVWRFMVWGVLLLVGTPSALFTLGTGANLTVLAFATAGGTFSLAQTGLLAGLQGLERLGKAALVVSLLGLAGNAALVGILFAGGDVVAVTAWGACMAAISLVATSIVFARATTGPVVVSRELVRSVAFAGRPYLAWDMGLLLYGSIDILLLTVLTDVDTVGKYALAYRVIGIPVFASTIVTMAIYPSLSASSTGNPRWFKELMAGAVRIVTLITVPMMIVIALGSGSLVNLLTDGGFDGAALLIVILSLHVPAAAISTILGMGLFAADRQARMAGLAWAASGLNVAANCVAIPVAQHAWNDGAVGAAIVTVLTEGFIGAMVWRWAGAFVDRREVLGGVMKTLAASVVMGAAMIAASSLGGIVLAVVVGGVSFVAASTIFGAVSPEEIRRLVMQLRSGSRELASVEA